MEGDLREERGTFVKEVKMLTSDEQINSFLGQLINSPLLNRGTRTETGGEMRL